VKYIEVMFFVDVFVRDVDEGGGARVHVFDGCVGGKFFVYGV